MTSSIFAIGATSASAFHPRLSNAEIPLVPIEPKAPRATDSRASSLARLSNEIVAVIADLLQSISPQTVYSLALVCSTYYRIARYTQYHELVLDNSSPRLAYVEKSDIPRAIRKLEVRNASGEFLCRLCELIPKMTGLRDIQWSGQGVPESVLRFLQTQPSIRLRAEVTDAWTPESLDRLQANQNLTSLKITIVYRNAEECIHWTQPLKRVLLSCPNVRKLSLDLDLPQNGCTMYFLPFEYCGLGLVDGERLPALEELELKAYPFGIYMPDQSHPRNVAPYSRGYPLDVQETDYWKDNFDWSQLRVLTAYHPMFCSTIMPQLTSLKEFNCTNYGPIKMHRSFRIAPTSLESISVYKLADIDVENLLRHGSTLRKLTIHQNEDELTKWGHETISAKTLIKIRDGCPHIEELGLDVARKDDWPYDILDILASFSSLRSLTIWFELGVADRNQPVQPYVNFSAAGKLFKHIHEHTTGPATRLQKITFVSGCARELGIGLPSRNSFWEMANSSTFICTLSDQEDDARRGVFATKCPKLSRDEHEYLRRFDAGEKHIGILLYLQEPLLVARDGPTPMEEWEGNKHDL